MPAYFVLSTGRCGTQWLAEVLQQWSDDYRVEHEPLHLEYRPDRNSPANPLAINDEILHAHLRFIQQQLDQGKTYIETGFPCWRHLRWFKQHLGQVRVIHIHRDPLDSVRSLLKLNAFVPPFLPHLPTKNLYLPGAEQDLLHTHQVLWPQLNPVEKNVWYWAEVQAQALSYQQDWPAADWLRLSFADLFSEQTRQQLAAFLGQTSAQHWPAQQKVDHFGMGYAQPQPELSALLPLKPIRDIAKTLGYTSLDSLNNR